MSPARARAHDAEIDSLILSGLARSLGDDDKLLGERPVLLARGVKTAGDAVLVLELQEV